MNTKLMIFGLVLIVAQIATISAQLGQQCHTPILNSRRNLNLSAISGDWYRIEMATFNDSMADIPPVYKCYQTTYTFSDNPLDLSASINYLSLDTDSWESDNGRITVPDTNLPGTWSVNWDEAGLWEQVVLATNHQSWAYIYECQMVGIYSKETLSIMSRSRTIDPTIRTFLKSLMTGLGFGGGKHQLIDQTGCN